MRQEKLPQGFIRMAQRSLRDHEGRFKLVEHGRVTMIRNAIHAASPLPVKMSLYLRDRLVDADLIVQISAPARGTPLPITYRFTDKGREAVALRQFVPLT